MTTLIQISDQLRIAADIESNTPITISKQMKESKTLMSDELRSFVVIFPDKSEHFRDAYWNCAERFNIERAKKVAEDAVREAGITTSRKNPQTVQIEVRILRIELGQIKRGNPWVFDITPPLMSLTEDDFNAEMTEILSVLPPEFADFVRQKSFDEGYAMYEKMLSIASTLTNELDPVIKKYRKSMR